MKPSKYQTRSKNYLIITCLTMVIVLAASGCSKKQEGDKPALKHEKDKMVAVAKIGESAITVADLKSYISDRPMPHSRQLSEEEIEKRLDEMILEHVLYQEALRLKLDQAPEVRQRIRRMLTQKLMDDRIDQEVWNREIKDNDLREYYDQHHHEFNHPEQVRLADIFVAVPADATDEERSERINKAESALAEALKIRAKRSGFGELIRKYSDTHEKYRKGDTGFFDKEGDPVGIDRSLAEAAFQLERIGSISERVIETPDGYHIVMLVGRRSAFHKGFDEVKKKIERQIRREGLEKTRQAYINGLKEKANISIDSKAIKQILKELRESQDKGPLSTRGAGFPKPGHKGTSPF